MNVNTVAEQVIAQAPDAVILADLDGVIRVWNHAAERIFGHTAVNALGQTLDLIVPEQFREAHWRGYRHALAVGETKYGGQVLPTRSLRKDGTTIYVELTFAIIRDSDGTVSGALAHARDITARWAQEREQRARLRALEQQVGKIAGA